MLSPVSPCLMVLIPAVRGCSLCLEHFLLMPPPQPTSIHILYFLFRSQLKHHISELFLDSSRLVCFIAISLMYDVSLLDSMYLSYDLLTIWAITCLPLGFLLGCKMLKARLCLVHHHVPIE